MEHYSIEPNKNIFIVFVGLTASGYNLAEDSCNRDIINSIREIKYDADIIDYFKKARTSTCEVNPYWPRTFLLSLSSLFITKRLSLEYTNFPEMLNYMKSLQQINPDEINEELINWLKELPIKIDELQDNSMVQEIWSKYISLVKENIEKYDLMANQSYSSIKRVLDISEELLPELIIIPNYLQAHEATDFVTIEDKIYIITARLDKESIVHELLHHILDIRLEECRDLIDENLYLLKPVLDEMVRYQYAWDYDKGSWSRVFEENFIRAISTWVIFHDDLNNARINANLHEGYGFIYVPIILEQLFLKWKGLDNIDEFVEDCLEECKKCI